MEINNKNIEFNEVLKVSNQQELILKRRDNGLRLSDYQINVLAFNGIDYTRYHNMHDLLFDIDFLLQDEYHEELEFVANQIEEILYYSETKK